MPAAWKRLDCIAGDVDTGFIERNLAERLPLRPEPSQGAALSAAASAAMLVDYTLTHRSPTPWRELVASASNAAPQTAAADQQPVPGRQAGDRARNWRRRSAPRSVLVTDEGEIVVFEAGEPFSFCSIRLPPMGR